MCRGDVDVVLWDPLIPLHDLATDVGATLGVHESLERETHGVRLRLEPTRGDERLELSCQIIWYANRNLNRHAKSIPPSEV